MTIEELFGTLQQAVVGSWRKHLRTAKYGKHVALNDFYEELPDLVDALIEGYMGATGKKIKGYDNIIQSKNMNTLTYLQELKKIDSFEGSLMLAQGSAAANTRHYERFVYHALSGNLLKQNPRFLPRVSNLFRENHQER